MGAHARSVAWAPDGTTLVVGCSTSDEDGGAAGGGGGAPVVAAFDVRAGSRPQAGAHLHGLPPALVGIALSPDGTALAGGAGTSVCVYDVRRGVGAPAMSASYIDSHSEEVGSVLWHPHLPGHLLTAADDGLVNIFDTRVATEMDAITATLAVNNSVKRMGVFGHAGAAAFTLTRTEGLLLWDLGSALPVADFSGLHAEFVASGTPLQELVDCHYSAAADDVVCLAAGAEGQLALLHVGAQACNVRAGFATGHRALVRAVAWLTDGVLVTGGEDGLLCLWAAPGVEAAGSGAAADPLAASLAKPVARRERQAFTLSDSGDLVRTQRASSGAAAAGAGGGGGRGQG